MITVDETLRIREIRRLVEGGYDELITREDRQWIIDIFKREGVVMPKNVFDAATEGGFDVVGVKVNHD